MPMEAVFRRGDVVRFRKPGDPPLPMSRGKVWIAIPAGMNPGLRARQAMRVWGVTIADPALVNPQPRGRLTYLVASPGPGGGLYWPSRVLAGE